MSDLIQPRTLKGFRDYPPELMIPRERLLEQARRVFRSYGFAPIDTPALEHAEILLGKGGEESDRLVYRFKDHGDRDVALRFDLTVPFARFAAQHIGRLGTPFKRYAMGPVWRGENTAHGRFREFWQVDFDLIGTSSNLADIEIVLVIHDLLIALGFLAFRVQLNNRLLLNGLLEELGLAEQATALLRVLDKLAKVGREAVEQEMVEKANISAAQASRVLDLTAMTGSNDEILAHCEKSFGASAKSAEGIRRLRELVQVLRRAGIPEDRFQIDLAIARGLDYYTGTIYETFLLDLPGIGSICSGGRYDNLAAKYTKTTLPGVGASLGLDRLLAAMEELKILTATTTPAQVLVVLFAPEHVGEYELMARVLRAHGILVEVYPDAKKIGAQLQYAEKRGHRLALIAGSDEFAKKVWKVKDLASRSESTVAEAEVPAHVRSLLEMSATKS